MFSVLVLNSASREYSDGIGGAGGGRVDSLAKDVFRAGAVSVVFGQELESTLYMSGGIGLTAARAVNGLA